MPKSVQNIVIDTKIINETGVLNDTYVNLDKLSFKIDQDVFNAKANIRNIAENPLVNAKLNGTINLSNVSKAYPVKTTVPLSGLLKADVITKFDMKSVETNQYEKMENSGNLTLTGFKYVDDAKKVMNINKAAVQFTNTRINLNELDLTTGKTDMKVNGVLENFYGFIFRNQEIKGNFNMVSNQFSVDDFMSAGTETKEGEAKPKEEAKAPTIVPASLVQRDEMLHGMTYKVKAGTSHAMYISMSYHMIDGKKVPYEVFMNSKNMDHFAWTVALTRMISAIFRRGGDVSFVVEELKAVFDPRGGSWIKGKYIPSDAAAIGGVIEQFMKDIGYIQSDPQLIEATAKEVPIIVEQIVAPILCTNCYGSNFKKESGCETCIDCGHSKCG